MEFKTGLLMLTFLDPVKLVQLLVLQKLQPPLAKTKRKRRNVLREKRRENATKKVLLKSVKRLATNANSVTYWPNIEFKKEVMNLNQMLKSLP